MRKPKPLFNESKLLTTIEALRRRALEKFGPGDKCTICEEPVQGFGWCISCGAAISNAQRCSRCGSPTIRRGVCRKCIGKRATTPVCSCGWMRSNDNYRFSNGWHLKIEADGPDTATELCPTYWSARGRRIQPDDKQRLVPLSD